MNIVYAVDRRYLEPMAASMMSVINHDLDKVISFHILHQEIHLEQQQQIIDFFSQYKVNIYFICVENQALQDLTLPESEYDAFNYFTQAIYFRLLIPSLLPDNVDKVIYLDADTIVCQPLYELWLINISSSPLAAVVEPYSPSDPPNFRYNHLIDLGITDYYFNSGVLVFNLKQLRNTNFLQKACYIAKKFSLVFPDQDILNMLFQHKTYFLPPKFNSLNCAGQPTILNFLRYFHLSGRTSPYTEEQALTAANTPHILHFFGKYKPWHLPGVYFTHKEKFWHFYNKSLYQTSASTLIEKSLLDESKNKQHEQQTF